MNFSAVSQKDLTKRLAPSVEQAIKSMSRLVHDKFFLGGYHPTLKLSGIPTFTFIVSLTHGMDNI